MATITVLGAGMMGTALCVPLIDRGHDVRLVGTHLDRDIIDSLKQRNHHPKLGLAVPGYASFYQVERLEEAMHGAEVLGLGVSSEGVRWAAQTLAPLLPSSLPIISVTKGLEWNGASFQILPDVLADELTRRTRSGVFPCAIAGPCIAGELARRVPTCVLFTGRGPSLLPPLVDLFRTDYYHIWASADAVGVEVCAALKNAYAMAVGFGAGIHERHGGTHGSVAMHNYEAAVFSQALAEMRQLVVLAGGDEHTVSGLAGAGDLTVTNNGGRTGRFGRLLGLGLSVEEAIAGMEGATLECLQIINVVAEALPALVETQQLSVDALPLMRHMISVVLEGAPVEMPFGSFSG